jgi:hypothetical protein
MSASSPPCGEPPQRRAGFLAAVVADGARPYRHRGRVRELLGLAPDGPRVTVLPGPADVFGALPARRRGRATPPVISPTPGSPAPVPPVPPSPAVPGPAPRTRTAGSEQAPSAPEPVPVSTPLVMARPAVPAGEQRPAAASGSAAAPVGDVPDVAASVLGGPLPTRARSVPSLAPTVAPSPEPASPAPAGAPDLDGAVITIPPPRPLATTTVRSVAEAPRASSPVALGPTTRPTPPPLPSTPAPQDRRALVDAPAPTRPAAPVSEPVPVSAPVVLAVPPSARGPVRVPPRPVDPPVAARAVAPEPVDPAPAQARGVPAVREPQPVRPHVERRTEPEPGLGSAPIRAPRRPARPPRPAEEPAAEAVREAPEPAAFWARRAGVHAVRIRSRR